MLTILVAACGSNDPPAVVPDAAPIFDDAEACNAPPLAPIAITGSSPNGPLDDFKFFAAGWAGGGCSEGYTIAFRTTDMPCAPGPSLSFATWPPYTPGSSQILVTLSGPPYITTNQATFEASQLDEPTVAMPRLVGHLVSHDPAWVFDIAIDTTSRSYTVCL